MTLENLYGNVTFCSYLYATPVDLLPLDVFWIILRLFFVRCSYTYVTYFILSRDDLLHTPDLALPLTYVLIAMSY